MLQLLFSVFSLRATICNKIIIIVIVKTSEDLKTVATKFGTVYSRLKTENFLVVDPTLSWKGADPCGPFFS